MEAFTMPDICLADMTKEDFIAGGRFSGRAFESLANQLQEFGYGKLF